MDCGESELGKPTIQVLQGLDILPLPRWTQMPRMKTATATFLRFVFLSGMERKDWSFLALSTQEDPVDPTVLDKDLEVGSDHSSDTESIDTRGGTSDAAGEVEFVSVP